jgi:hypothetical protein
MSGEELAKTIELWYDARYEIMYHQTVAWSKISNAKPTSVKDVMMVMNLERALEKMDAVLTEFKALRDLVTEGTNQGGNVCSTNGE